MKDDNWDERSYVDGMHDTSDTENKVILFLRDATDMLYNRPSQRSDGSRWIWILLLIAGLIFIVVKTAYAR